MAGIVFDSRQGINVSVRSITWYEHMTPRMHPDLSNGQLHDMVQIPKCDL